MSRVLVTGASGFIGTPLVARLAAEHTVISLSRREVAGADLAIEASFASAEDLRRLDPHEVDVAVHLAAELEHCSEETALAVNVAGTRTLLRYLIDRGCRRLVLASSIAAAGCMTESFVPREVPIPDDHPCDATDAYGLSKALVEELAFYFHRRDPDLEIDLLRVGGVLPESEKFERFVLAGATRPFLTGGGHVSLRDTVETFARAVESPLGPGVHRLNVVAEESLTLEPVSRALERVLGERAAGLDLSFYEAAGNETKSLYTVDRLREIYGVRASVGLLDQPGGAAPPTS